LHCAAVAELDRVAGNPLQSAHCRPRFLRGPRFIQQIVSACVGMLLRATAYCVQIDLEFGI
jgi:hypothetical protein